MSSGFRSILRRREHSRSRSGGDGARETEPLPAKDGTLDVTAKPSAGAVQSPTLAAAGEEQTHRPRGNQYENISMHGSSRGHFGDAFYTGGVHHHWTTVTSAGTDGQDCLKSLYFAEIDKTVFSIEDAHPRTFTWLWSRPNTQLDSWMASPNGLFWIQGNPGSGKSTLMKSLAKGIELKQRICDVLRTSSYAVAFFAFTVKSSDIAGSIAGMLRSLLWQLAQVIPSALEPVLDHYTKLKTSQPTVSWNVQDLRSVLLSFLWNCPSTAVCILVDGLDEHHGRDEVIAQFLDNFAASIPPHVRLCLASRPYPDFAFQFHNTKGLTLHENTANDISIYIRHRFIETAIFKNTAYDQLAEAAIAKAKGSFLWAKLACNELQQNWRRYQSLDRLKSCLENLPPELAVLYMQIFDQLGANEAEDLARMLATLASSNDRLSLLEFCNIMDLTSSYSTSNVQELLPYRLEDRLRNLAEQGRLPSNCHCRIVSEVSDDGGFSESIIRAACSRLPVVTTEQSRSGTQIGGNILEDETFRLHAQNMEESHGFPELRLPEDTDAAYVADQWRTELDPVETCTHTMATICRSELLSEGQWRTQVAHRINMAGRGFIQATTSSVTFSHETVADFWSRNMAKLWNRPPWEGQEMLLHACISYLNMLEKFDVFPDGFGPDERERYREHYHFLRYSSENFKSHCRESERISQSSQVQNMLHVSSETLRLWERVSKTRQTHSRWPLGLNNERVLDLLEFTLEFRMDLTASDLTTTSAQVMLSGSRVDFAKCPRQMSAFTGGSLLFLAAGNDNEKLVQDLINFGARLDPKLPYTATAPHRAVFENNLRCLKAFLEGCVLDSRIRNHTAELYFTAAPELFVFDSRHWHRELVDNSLASNLLQFCVVVGNEQAFGIVMSYADRIPTVVGDLGASLVSAIYYEQVWAVKALIEAGADLDYLRDVETRIYCPLATAISRHNAEICLMLLAAGADPTAERPSVETLSGPKRNYDAFIRFGRTWLREKPFFRALSEYIHHRTSTTVRVICLMLRYGASLPESLFERRDVEAECGEWLGDAYHRYHLPRNYSRVRELTNNQDMDDELLSRALVRQPANFVDLPETNSYFGQIRDQILDRERLAATLPPRPPSRMGY